MIKISCKTCSNTHCLVQRYCSTEWIEIIDRSKDQVYFKQSDKIINEGFTVRGVFFIQKGKVKVYSSGLNGREQIVRFANDGHILGHRGLGHEVYPISAIALEDSTICFIENELLYEMFMNNPKFTYSMMMFYSRELRKIEDRMKNVLQMNTREKIAKALLILHENFGLNGQNELNVSITRREIANTIGSTVQQIATHLTNFEEENLIAKRGRKIAILNLDKLKKIVIAHNSYVFTE